MRTPETIRLPSASLQYDMNNEIVARRSIEQFFQDLRNDILETRNASNKSASLAQRRHQFLLMGASNG